MSAQGVESIYGTNLVRISGDEKDGIYESVITVPTSTATNVFQVTINDSIVDIWGNYGYPEDSATVSVENALSETDAPVLSELSVDRTEVDVTNDSAEVTFQIRITDESGITDSFENIRTYMSAQGVESIYGTNLVRISGDEKDGIYESVITVPTSTATNVFQVTINDSIVDIWGNYGYPEDSATVSVIKN